MDDPLERRASPFDLYLRWEAQQWSTKHLDFTEDRVHWGMIDEAAPPTTGPTLGGTTVGDRMAHS